MEGKENNEDILTLDSVSLLAIVLLIPLKGISTNVFCSRKKRVSNITKTSSKVTYRVNGN